tara:strand:- start:393 stop:584 length:192 start_codon:yes stop_codon:yes gene_type:complete
MAKHNPSLDFLMENNNILSEQIVQLNVQKDNYKKGFELLYQYWDSIPDMAKEELHVKLKKLGL